MWDLIVSVPDHCLSFYFESFIELSLGIFLKTCVRIGLPPKLLFQETE